MSFEVRLVDISHRIGTAILFEKITASVSTGENLLITGKGGSGKSTLLEIIAGIIPSQTGSVIWDGNVLGESPRVVIADLEQRSSVVFQQHALISYLPLFENIALPLRYHRRGTKAEIDECVSALIERLNLKRYAWQLPESLSVGQKRLGAIARALAIDPEMICMDEPTDGLDSEQKQLFLPVYEELMADTSVTMIVATADQTLLENTDSPIINLSYRA